MYVCVSHLEMSPQYHSASCKEMLLLKLLGVAGVEHLTGLGGNAETVRERERFLQFCCHC